MHAVCPSTNRGAKRFEVAIQPAAHYATDPDRCNRIVVATAQKLTATTANSAFVFNNIACHIGTASDQECIGSVVAESCGREGDFFTSLHFCTGWRLSVGT